MAKDLEAIIRISGDIDKSIKSAIDGVTKNLDQMEAAARKAGGEVGELAGKIADQSEVLEVAKKKYASYVLAGEKGSKEAKNLKKQITQLSGELKDNKTRLAGAESAADKLTGGLDDLDKAARDAGDGLGVMDIALGNIVASGVGTLVDKAADGAAAIYGLAENTQEYREDMGKLETAWESAGKSTELATDTYKNFYSVLGEEDRSVEAVNHLAKFVNTEKDMQKWTDICTGVWGTFGDSLPIEGLTEASNETAKVGKVTGVLADALNWAGVNEDTFNEALEGMNSEQERAAFITETLNGLYSTAADKYRENNATIIEARKAQSDYTDTLAAMGEKIEPATTAVKEGMNKVLTKILEVMEKTDFTEIAGQIGELTDKAINLATNGIGWLKDNMDWLIPVVSGLTAAFVAYKAISLGVAAVEAIKTAVLATGATTMSIATVATWALNSAMAVLTSPILLVVAAIAAVVAIGVALYRNWDTIKAKAAELGAWLSEKFTAIKTAVSNAVGSMVTAVSEKWNNLKAKASEMVANVRAKISSGFSALKGIMMKPFQSVINIISKVKSAISGITDKVKNIGSSIGSKVKSLIPGFASGGFTQGLSFAGEAGTEAVISFDRRYREANLGYWAQAGRMLDADFSDFALSGESGGDYFDMGGVTFAPNITIHGNADKQSIMEAIEAEYPEFIDMLEEWFKGRGVPVYA